MAASSTSPKTRSKSATAAKKNVVKKPSIKMPSKKPSPKKSTAKTATLKSSAKSAVKTKSSTNKKLTVAAQLANLEARLKRANAATRKNVKTLEQLVASLEAQSKTARTTQKAAFTRQVNALNKKLTSLMEDSQAEIAKDLSTAMATQQNGPQLDNLEAALTRANDRLEQTEISQSDAITKINRHLANLASALETRFEDETAARTAAISASESRLEKNLLENTADLTRKVETIETDTAAALETVGGKIENFAIELDQRQIRLDAQIGDKVSEIALQTQAEFETFRSDVDARLDDISSRTPANTASDRTRLDGQMNILQDRLDNLEQYLADLNTQQTPQLASPLPTSTNIAAPLPTQISPAQTPAQLNPMQPHVSAPSPSNVVPITDAFAPSENPISAYNNTLANPYSQPADTIAAPSTEVAPQPAPSPAESHMPVEFDPAAYQAQTTPQVAPAPSLPPIQAPVMDMASMPTAPEAAHAPYVPIVPQAVTTPPPILPPIGASGEFQAPINEYADLLAEDTDYVEPALPYSNPAYAEDNSLRAERIGEPMGVSNAASGKSRKSQKLNIPNLPINGGHVRLLLLGSALAVLLLFAGKMVLNGDDYAPIPEQSAAVSAEDSNLFQTASNTAPSQDQINAQGADDISFAVGAPTQAPIGQYTENTAPVISQDGLATLEGAATSGNPIAQHQLGMSRLEAGDIEAGVKLVRAAAAQNLPAAQYRLAKLYEIGQGVERDEAQARQLTERAAKSGHRIAMHDLALYYTDGRGGVDINVATAAAWFEQAAQHGVVDSQFNLAVLAESGQGVARDVDTAYFWYNIAAKQGDQFAQKRVQLITDSLTPEQINAANARIAAFTPRPVNAEVNGVFANVPWNKPVQNVKIDQIRQAQSYLAELGYEVGTPDGAIGPLTRSAIREFERSYELPETGAVDDNLLNRLELAIGA